jgi:hypothetical protein
MYACGAIGAGTDKRQNNKGGTMPMHDIRSTVIRASCCGVASSHRAPYSHSQWGGKLSIP